VRLWDRSLPVDSLAALEQLQLSYKAYVTIEFSALNYNKLNKLEYYYQLEGLDTAWVRSNDDHRAVYSFLPPGGYTFRLRTRDVSGEWNPGEASLRIFVTPPFYKSWWFVLSLLLLGAAVLYVLYRERIRRLVTLHNIRSDIANHLHKDVSTTLNNINVLSQIARMKADRDIDRSKELIDEISGKSYNMMVSMDEILWSIDPGNDTMEKTLLRIEEFTKTLETGYGITIEMIVHQKVKDLRLDMRVRHDFFVICKAALQQLAQGAIADSIMMDIDLAWSKIVIKILANGTGTEEKAPALAELKKAMEEKATAMQASLVFETGSRDTSIILSIPVRPHTLTPYTIFSSRR
jgi:signal transduction histidine kinase